MDASNGHGEANGVQPVASTDDDPREVQVATGEEDATTLVLGPEFQLDAGAQALFISEVAHLLKEKVKGRQGQEIATEIENPILMKSLKYANRFGQIANTEQAIAVRNQLQAVEPHLHPFEIAQIATLMPKDAEEAKAIIPSLAARYDDDVLNNILKDLDVWL